MAAKKLFFMQWQKNFIADALDMENTPIWKNPSTTT